MAYNYTALPSPVINYITNSTADNDTVGWATYADAAQATPVDGTGGSPQSSLWIRSTTSPLRKNASFRLDKTGSASRQGQGVSFDFTIDKADTAKVLSVSFDYEVAAGTYANGDVTVYIYDVTNATVIQPAGYIVQNVASGTENKHIATFQTHATSTSYRLILHIASTSAQNYTLAIDNVVVGPQTVQYGAPITDWQSYTPTLTNAGNATATGRYRRVGDSIEAAIRVVIGSSLPTGNIFYSLPTGLSLDLTKFPNNGSNNEILGYAQGGAANLSHVGVVLLTSSNQVGVYGDDGSDIWNATNPITWANGNQIQINFRAPIAGFSSTVQMSSDTDTRVVAAIYSQSTNYNVLNSTTTILDFATKELDTHNAVLGNGSGPVTTTNTGFRYIVPVPGIYELKASVLFDTTQGTAWAENETVDLSVKVNNVGILNLDRPVGLNSASASSFCFARGSGLLSVNAGDRIEIVVNQNSGATQTVLNSSSYTRFMIHRISGPSAIAATETVALSYYSTATTAFGNGPTTVAYATKNYDSHNAWNGTVFTAPVAGKYRFTAGIFLNGVVATGQNIWLRLRNITSGVEQYIAAGNHLGTANFENRTVSGSATIDLLAGQTADIRLSTTTAGNQTQTAGSATSQFNFLMVERVGN